MPIQTKVNGAIKAVSNCKVKVNGAWKQVTTALIKENGAWKQAWRNIIELRRADGDFHFIPVSGATASSKIVITEARLYAVDNGVTNSDGIGKTTIGSEWVQIKVVRYPKNLATVGFKVVDGGLRVSFTGSDSTYVTAQGTDIRVTINGITLS